MCRTCTTHKMESSPGGKAAASGTGTPDLAKGKDWDSTAGFESWTVEAQLALLRRGLQDHEWRGQLEFPGDAGMPAVDFLREFSEEANCKPLARGSALGLSSGLRILPAPGLARPLPSHDVEGGVFRAWVLGWSEGGKSS